ncbi:MAG: response regulator [Bacteroidota bacterium]
MDQENKYVIFIVDDDPLFSQALEQYLKERFPGMSVERFATGEACIHALDRKPHTVILDYRLDSEFPGAWDGLKVMHKINAISPETCVIILSSQEKIQTALQFIREGAYEYLVKDEQAFPAIQRIVSELLPGEEDETENDKEEAGNSMYRIIGVLVLLILISLLITG